MDLTPPPAPKGRFVQAGKNSYYLLEMGEGRPVIFLHGGGPGCTAWSDFAVVAPMFAKTSRCIMPDLLQYCLLYTSPSPRDATLSRMPSSA